MVDLISVAPNFDGLIFLLELSDLKYSVRRFRGFLTIVFSRTGGAVEVEVLGSEIICSSSDKCNSCDLTVGDVISLELRDFVRYLAFISSVHFSHLLICLIILDPFLLITVLYKRCI